jgi:hypothetical protein
MRPASVSGSLGSVPPPSFSFFLFSTVQALCPYLPLSLFGFVRFFFKIISFMMVFIRFRLDLAICAMSTLPPIIFLRRIFSSSRSEFFDL